jgi:uncharacterized delta-60 repeat protein
MVVACASGGPKTPPGGSGTQTSDADGDICRSAASAPSLAGRGANPVVRPLDLSLAVAGAASTFGIAAHGAGGDFVVGVVGTAGNTLVRYHEDGTLDTSFGSGGVVSLGSDAGMFRPFGFVVDANGAILVVGQDSPTQDPAVSYIQTNVAIRRYDDHGKLDASYGTAGTADLNFGAGTQVENVDWALGTDRSIALAVEVRTAASLVDTTAGYSYAVARVTANGAFDKSFGTNGTTTIPGYDTRFAPPTIGLQPDGAIVFGARTGEYRTCASGSPCPPDIWFRIVRVTPAGALDPAFPAVETTPNSPNDFDRVAVLPSGKILVRGGQSGAAPGACSGLLFERRNADGTLDTTFGKGGDAADFDVTCSAHFSVRREAFARRPDGVLVVPGGSDADLAAVAIDPCGVRMSSFAEGGLAVVHLDPAFKSKGVNKPEAGDGARFVDIAALPDGRTVATGTTYVSCGDCSLNAEVFVVELDDHGAPAANFAP